MSSLAASTSAHISLPSIDLWIAPAVPGPQCVRMSIAAEEVRESFGFFRERSLGKAKEGVDKSRF